MVWVCFARYYFYTQPLYSICRKSKNRNEKMANRWGIPKVVEDIVIDRDKRCVYCQSEFDKTGENRKTRSTWEHIINDIKLNKEDNIALCCGSCNASKGSKLLEDWLKSKYCLDKKITKETVSEVVKNHIDN